MSRTSFNRGWTVRPKVSPYAQLQGFGSGRPDNTESYQSGEHTSFDGRLLAIVRPTGVGPIVVRVSSTGHEDAEVRLIAIEPHSPIVEQPMPALVSKELS